MDSLACRVAVFQTVLTDQLYESKSENQHFSFKYTSLMVTDGHQLCKHMLCLFYFLSGAVLRVAGAQDRVAEISLPQR